MDHRRTHSVSLTMSLSVALLFKSEIGMGDLYVGDLDAVPGLWLRPAVGDVLESRLDNVSLCLSVSLSAFQVSKLIYLTYWCYFFLKDKITERKREREREFHVYSPNGQLGLG